jgi:ferredoxin-NADP reductase
MGWASKRNGDLLRVAVAAGFDAFLTVDRRLQHQQNLSYSIVSSPHDREVEFFIELVPGGELTPQLHELQSGNEILMRKVAKGRCLLETSEPHKNHLLVSTVTGVAPYVSTSDLS